MKKILSILFGAYVLVGCYGKPSLDNQLSRITLEVKNTGVENYKIYLSIGGPRWYLGTLFPNERGCYYLPQTTVNGNIIIENSRETAVSPSFTPDQYNAWTMEIGNIPRYDVVSLKSARIPCRK
jgi:hypothetical protein